MKRIYIFLITIFSLLLTSNLTVAQLPGLWGMTSQGGPDNMGVIFKTDGSGDNQNVAYSFVKEYEGAHSAYWRKDTNSLSSWKRNEDHRDRSKG